MNSLTCEKCLENNPTTRKRVFPVRSGMYEKYDGEWLEVCDKVTEHDLCDVCAILRTFNLDPNNVSVEYVENSAWIMDEYGGPIFHFWVDTDGYYHYWPEEGFASTPAEFHEFVRDVLHGKETV